MSHIDELIAKFAPNGVEYRRIGDIAEVGTGSSDRKDATDEGRFPFYVRSKHVMGIDEFEFDEEAVLIPGEGGIGEIFHFVSGKYALHQRAYRISFRVPDLDTKYAYYYFAAHFKKFILRKAVSATVTSIRKPMITDFRIPVPPLEVQREIVRVLDQFTQLEAELEAELEARRRQYEHYRRQILQEVVKDADWVPLGELGRIVTGRTPKSSDASAWGSECDFVTPSDIKNNMRLIAGTARRLSAEGAASMANAYIPAGSLLVTCIGTVGKTVVNANDCVTNQQINAIIPKTELDVGYMFHVLTNMREQLRRLGEQGGGMMPLINKSAFSGIEVPLPDLARQRNVSAVLDKFHALMSDISEGLPAELAARRKQYEYYRDKLLTFEEAAA